MEMIITTQQVAPCNQQEYCENMVTEDNKKRKTTNDIISD